MIRNTTKNAGTKEQVSRKSSSGLVQLMSALHQNAAAVVTSTSHLNGPDQLLQAENYTTVKRNGCVKLRREDHGMASEEPLSVPTLLFDTAKAHPEVVAMRVRREGEWMTWTYNQYLNETQLIARAFINIGLKRHHSVAILGSNSPEWVISNLAAIFAGGIAVGLFPDINAEDLSKICIDCKADIIVVENEKLLKRVLLVQHKLPQLKAIIQLAGEPPISDKRRLYKSHKKHIISWAQMIEIGEDLPEVKLEDRLRRVAINQCCSIVYTSGTDGTTKGVMMSHDNVTWCSKMLLGLIRAPGFNKLPMAGEEMVLSFMPLSHISEQITNVFYTISVAGTLAFGANDVTNQEMLLTNDLDLFEAVLDIQPTVFFGFPAIYEQIYNRLREMKRSTSGFQRILLDWGNRAMKHKHFKNDVARNEPTRKVSQIKNSVAKNAVTKKYKELLGFHASTTFLSRGAPICKEVLQYLAGFDILVHETYGRSENCGILTANIPKRYCKLGTAGKALPGVKIKIEKSDGVVTPMVDGEPGYIWGYGRNIFMGYLHNENETKAAVDEEHWLKQSGDLGYTDDDGFVVVLGKKENFITLRSEEVISPYRIEQLIRVELPCLKQAMVVGDGQAYLAALLTLNTMIDERTGQSTNVLTEDAQSWFRHARFKMRTVEEVIDGLNGGLQHVIQAGIDRVNQLARSSSYMIADWRIMPSQWSYKKGELGLTGKLKRSAIKERHAQCIGSLFVHKERFGFNSRCEANADLMHQIPCKSHIQLTQIQEEDETKTPSRSSIEKEIKKTQEDANMKEFSEEVTKKLSVHESKENDESDEDSDDELSEDQKQEKITERKTSEQRIVAIVHPSSDEVAAIVGEEGEEYLDSLEPGTPTDLTLERSIAKDLNSESSQQR